MLKKLGESILIWSTSINPWTNVYGLARTIIALSTAITLAVNPSWIFFRPAAGIDASRTCTTPINYFCTVPFNYTYLEILRWLAVVILIVVASGWRPRYTGILHWWIVFSLQTSAKTLDGGEQVATILTLMLIPITLTDSRKWHWQREKKFQITNMSVINRTIALVCFVAIRIQVAIIYLNASMAKTSVSDWMNGTAVYYYMKTNMLGLPPLLSKIFEPFLTSIWVLIPTWGTIIAELLLFAGFFIKKKHRKWFLILGISLHTIFAVMLGLYSFSLIMIGALILYLRPVEKEFKFIKIPLFRGLFTNFHTLKSEKIKEKKVHNTTLFERR
ncbi:sporulation-delaying protein SdpB family protein [Tuberibacillus calidus]|jgi:antimicrobial peptide system SdpB family protein|uniref:sporulation-delaying protein SdpB family protein n=1 Tax=Tuberibacillus calidus TaxID=340097 RepID=UPI000412007E|nr:sporulation-delaying protein SdpB family protein [Tuberibacillus calidus]